MDWLSNLLNGMMTGLGMWIMMTVLGMLSFYAIKKWFVQSIAELWLRIKEEGLKLDGITVESQLKTKKIFEKKEKDDDEDAPTKGAKAL